jgi:hypothetical protein
MDVPMFALMTQQQGQMGACSGFRVLLLLHVQHSLVWTVLKLDVASAMRLRMIDSLACVQGV